MQSTFPLTLDQPIHPRPQPRPIVKRGEASAATQDAIAVSAGVVEDEQEVVRSGMAASGPVVGEIDEEPSVAVPERRYPLRSRRY